jgi:hypothetical protein
MNIKNGALSAKHKPAQADKVAPSRRPDPPRAQGLAKHEIDPSAPMHGQNVRQGGDGPDSSGKCPEQTGQ